MEGNKVNPYTHCPDGQLHDLQCRDVFEPIEAFKEKKWVARCRCTKCNGTFDKRSEAQCAFSEDKQHKERFSLYIESGVVYEKVECVKCLRTITNPRTDKDSIEKFKSFFKTLKVV